MVALILYDRDALKLVDQRAFYNNVRISLIHLCKGRLNTVNSVLCIGCNQVYKSSIFLRDI